MKVSKKNKPIKVSKKKSDAILKNFKKHGVKTKTKRIKEIRFHTDFDKGTRFVFCKNCGYPIMFWGMWLDKECTQCDSRKIKVYNRLDKFICDMQDWIVKQNEHNERRNKEI